MLLAIVLVCSLVSHCRSNNAIEASLVSKETNSATTIQQARSHVYQEAMPHLSARDDIVKRSPVEDAHMHEVIFAVQQKNMDQILSALHNVSDTDSPNYGHHWSNEQIAALTFNPEGRDAIVSYLHSNGASVKSESLYGDYITAIAPVSVWGKVLDTKFHVFHQRQSRGNIVQLVRAEAYSIPVELEKHVDCVLNTIEMPPKYAKMGVKHEAPREMMESNIKGHFKTSGLSYGYILPTDLRRYYNMSTNKGSNSSTQAAFSTNEDWFSPNDLKIFQTFDNVYLRQPALIHPNGHASSDAADLLPYGDWGEGNLDIQFLIGVSRGSPTTYWHFYNGLARWLVSMRNMIVPNQVLSISYGCDEIYMSLSEYRVFEIEAIKLSLRGTTIFAASGDDGASSHEARGGLLSKCDYRPIFPASSPYVVAVGATSGAENGEREVVCSANTTGRITSGGGFSDFYSQPTWQASAVAGYFKAAASAGQAPIPGFNAKGRAYPDISIAGLNYLTIIDKRFGGMSGTSASAPVVAGIVSNINAARMAVGKGSVGWLNPALYTHAASFVNDIVTGNNKCTATAPCCPQGFYATKGWDPATGLGSINYAKMQAKFLSLGTTNAISASPSVSPTLSPTPSPTIAPTPRPTRMPSLNPSKAPTSRPTRRPTMRRASLLSSSKMSESSAYVPTLGADSK